MLHQVGQSPTSSYRKGGEQRINRERKERWREWEGKARRRVGCMSRRNLPSWGGGEDLRSHRRGRARTHPDLGLNDSSSGSQSPQPLAQVMEVQAATL